MDESQPDEFTTFEIVQDTQFDLNPNENSDLRQNGNKDLKDDNKDVKETFRETWGGELESVLSLVVYTFGLWNIWRFTYFCYKNGGGCAIIPFILFLTVCGGPLYYMEVCLGQWSGSSPITVWNICPLFKGVGLVMVTLSLIYIWYCAAAFSWVIYFLIQSFYPTLPWSTCGNSWNTDFCIGVGLVMVTLSLIYIWYCAAAFSWVIYFLIQSFYPTLPWSTCGNSWNTDFCIDASTNTSEKMLNLTNYALNSSIKLRTAGTEYFERNVLQMSSGIDTIGPVHLHLVGCLFLGWLMVFLCLAKGVKTLGKVVYVTVTLPYILLTALLIRGVTLDGAWNGLQHYFIPDFSRLMHGQVWIEAAVQCFFSLGPTWGGVITMASFNKFNHNALRDSVVVCFFDAFTGMYSGVVVFSVLGFLSKETGTPLDELPFSGPGLAFIAYPEALSRLPAPHVWSVLFFLTLVLVGIDTQFGCFETVTNAMIDLNYEKQHRYRFLISAGLVTFLFIMGLPLTTSAGYYIFMLVDSYIGTYVLVGTALLECIIIAWIYGAYRFSSDIEMMLGSRPSIILRIIWCFIIPVFLLGILVPTIVTYSTPTVGDYDFTTHAHIVGNVFAFAPISLIFIVVIYQLIQQRDSRKSMWNVLKPASCWLPNDLKQRKIYRKATYAYESGFRHRFLVNILGIKSDNDDMWALKNAA